mgnify:CR=1 FL=1
MNLGDWIVQIIVWGSFLGGSYALLYKFGRPIVTALFAVFDHSVKLTAVPAPIQNTSLAQSDATDRSLDQSEPDSSERPKDQSEPLTPGDYVYITREDLVRSLALVVLTDDNNRQLSQEVVSKAAGISKEVAAKWIHEMRGTAVQPKTESADPRFPELTSQGRQVASNLRTRAKA